VAAVKRSLHGTLPSLVFLACFSGCTPAGDEAVTAPTAPLPAGKYETATLGAGCFWCVEAVFKELDGVVSVLPGYSGGRTVDPTYEQVCAGGTGHAEVAQIIFDPAKVSFAGILEVFWWAHDPTTKDQQGADTGSQYRSVIFFHDAGQKEVAEALKKKLDSSGAYQSPVVTEISQFKAFYPAENYHKDYFANHPENPYCQSVIRPKMDKFRKVFRERIRK
jgi:peptide-methionine (S)-S-oxide reductase